MLVFSDSANGTRATAFLHVMEAVPEAADLEALLSESAWIGALAASLIGDTQRAEDIAQDVRLAALRRQAVGGALTRPWLVTVARNATRMLHRSEGARAGREAERGRNDAARSASSPPELLANLETQELVSRLVRDLPPELADVLLLSFYEGHDSEQIARLRGVPTGTVRWRKKRALELLRERLTTHFNGDRSEWLSALAPLTATGWRSGARAAASSGLLAGTFAPWIAMSLHTKLISIAAVCALFAIPFFRGGSGAPVDEPATADAPRAEPTLAAVPRTEERLAPVAPSTLTERASAAPRIAAADETEVAPTTRVRLRVVDTHGQPIAGARVRFSLSFSLQVAHERLLSDLGPLRLAGLQAELTRETGADGVAEWETDLLRASGQVDFLVEGPRHGTGSIEALLEVGGTLDLGDVTLARGGAVEGTVRDSSGAPLRRVIVALGPAMLREDGSAPESPDSLGLLDWDLGTARTNARGRYHMAGVAAGDYRAYAKTSMDGAVAWSDALIVHAETLTANVDLRCETDSRGSGPAHILVRGADGEPLSTAVMIIRSDGHAKRSSVNAAGIKALGPYGRFSGGRLEVSDSSFVHRTTVIDRLPLSVAPLVVQLELATVKQQPLALLDRDGRRIEGATVKVTAKGRKREWQAQDGGVTLTLPAADGERFNLFIDDRRYHPLTLRGLSFTDLPEDWSLTLNDMPAIRGVVIAGGEPVVGAKVVVQKRAAAGRVRVKGNGVSLLHPSVIDESESERGGVFQVYTAEEGPLVVTASVRGFADTVVELGPHAGSPSRADLRLEMQPFGSLRGTVFDHQGQPAPRANVVLVHPFRKLLRTRARKDGSFRFRRVPEGDWVLRVVAELEDGFFALQREVPDGFEFPVNCTVVAGQESSHDVSLAEPTTITVRGHWSVRGADAGQFTAKVSDVVDDDPFSEPWESSTVLTDGEAFELSMPGDRPARFTLSAPGMRGDIWRNLQVDELPLEQDVTLALATLRLRNPNAAATGDVYVEWRHQGWNLVLFLAPDEEGLFPPEIVPAGEVTLIWIKAGADEPTSLRIQLTVGEEREVALR